MPKLVSIRPTYKILTSNYLSRTLLFFASYADFFRKRLCFIKISDKRIIFADEEHARERNGNR